MLRICLRLSRRHPVRTLLMIVGIALGVAGVISIDISKTSIGKSFELSTASLTASSTHQIVGSNFTIPQTLFTDIRTRIGIRASAPVISKYVKADQMGDKPYTLMGIDPFSEMHFRSFETMAAGEASPLDLFSDKAGILISKFNAENFGLTSGSPISLKFGEKKVSTRVSGLLDSEGKNGNSPIDGIILTDIATAQEILGMSDAITRIDLVLTDKSQEAKIQDLLPKGVFLVQTDKQNQTIRQLSESFETSLTAFSMLALFMGIFLIYNTISFAVARRRHIHGILKALGATQKDIFFSVILEVFVFALAGSVIGVLLGVLLGKGAVAAVCSTVSDMYFVLTVSQVHIGTATLFKGFAAGISASLAACIFPAVAASRTIPITLMQRSASESRIRKKLPLLSISGILLLVLAGLILKGISPDARYDYLGVFMIFLGSSLLAPGVVTLMFRSIVLPVKKLKSVLLKMAVRNIVRSLSRTSVLIASLMVVISVFIGIEIMTGSFRASIEHWVDGNIGGHIHVSSADDLKRGLDPDLMKQIEAMPQVKDISAYNIHSVYSMTSGEVHIFSYLNDLSEKEWTWTHGPQDQTDPLLESGWILVSEIFARKNGFNPEVKESVILETLYGPVAFRIAGVFRDFFLGGGRVVVSRETMTHFWGHDDITSMQIFLKSKTDIEPAIDQIRQMIPETDMVKVVAGQSIKESILNVFDKTFLITTALQILTAIVAFTGILNAVMALLLERKREMGILRACGAQSNQVGRLILMECGINGLVSGLMALPLGLFLAWVLIDIVNQRSFGWSYDMVFSAGVLFQAIFLSVSAALIAGIFPALRAGSTDIGQALHME